jgi:type IV pilus assembly protein PilA
MRKNRGFTLIELLIVITIILIIAAIAIPSLIQAKISADEASAVNSIRTLNTAQVSYQSVFPQVGYAATIAALGPAASTGCSTPSSANACLVDWVVAQATTPASPKAGYYFAEGVVTSGGVNSGYTIGGAPTGFNRSGVRGFCSNEDAGIHFIPALSGPPVTTAPACSAYPAMR